MWAGGLAMAGMASDCDCFHGRSMGDGAAKSSTHTGWKSTGVVKCPMTWVY